MKFKFEYWKARGTWWWHLRWKGALLPIARGQLEGYTRRLDVLRAIELVRGSGSAAVVHVKAP